MLFSHLQSTQCGSLLFALKGQPGSTTPRIWDRASRSPALKMPAPSELESMASGHHQPWRWAESGYSFTLLPTHHGHGLEKCLYFHSHHLYGNASSHSGKLRPVHWLWGQDRDQVAQGFAPCHHLPPLRTKLCTPASCLFLFICLGLSHQRTGGKVILLVCGALTLPGLGILWLI